MCDFGLKCQRIGALVKANYKRLKSDLASGVKKLGPVSVAPKLGEFLLFDEFFPDLADFQGLDVFWPFDFPDFLASLLPPPPPIPNPTTSPLLFPTSGPDTSGDQVVFSIEVSRAAILLKP